MNTIEADEIRAEDTAEPSTGRSLQTLAVVTLVLGLLSPLALVRTLFWVIPLVAVILGVISLRSLATHPEKCGRKVAICGMLLALLFGAWGPSRYYTRHKWLFDEARDYADAWMYLIQQRKFYEAHQLHGTRGQRAAEDVSLEEHYRSDKEGQRNYYMFFGAGPLEAIAQSAGPIEAHFEQLESQETNKGIDQVVLRYRVSIEDRGRRREIPLRVILRRAPDGETDDHQWYVEGTRDY